MQERLALLLLASTGSLLACDDTQEPVVPEPFHLRIVLEDPQGNPVPGLRVSAFNDVDEFVLPDRLPCAEAQSTAKPLGAASLRFCLPESASVRIVVRDVEDTPVRQLLDRMLPAGAHQLVWDTRDDAGLPLPGGV